VDDDGFWAYSNAAWTFVAGTAENSPEHGHPKDSPSLYWIS